MTWVANPILAVGFAETLKTSKRSSGAFLRPSAIKGEEKHPSAHAAAKRDVAPHFSQSVGPGTMAGTENVFGSSVIDKNRGCPMNWKVERHYPTP